MYFEKLLSVRVSPDVVERMRSAAESHNTTSAQVWRTVLDGLDTQEPMDSITKPSTDVRKQVVVRVSERQYRKFMLARALNACTAVDLFESVNPSAAMSQEVVK